MHHHGKHLLHADWHGIFSLTSTMISLTHEDSCPCHPAIEGFDLLTARVHPHHSPPCVQNTLDLNASLRAHARQPPWRRPWARTCRRWCPTRAGRSRGSGTLRWARARRQPRRPRVRTRLSPQLPASLHLGMLVHAIALCCALHAGDTAPGPCTCKCRQVQPPVACWKGSGGLQKPGGDVIRCMQARSCSAGSRAPRWRRRRT
jgi:hypothetical protein